MKNFNIGITGRRDGCNDKQLTDLKNLLNQYKFLNREGDVYLHHGDCIGVDTEAHDIGRELGFNIIIHPPIKDDCRAFNKSHFIHEEKTYFKRNRYIVDSCDIVIGVPPTNYDVGKGGTWYTINYAIKRKVPLVIIKPKIHLVNKSDIV